MADQGRLVPWLTAGELTWFDQHTRAMLAEERPVAEYIFFCGVHLMAESADILTADHQQVSLPDLNAGWSMTGSGYAPEDMGRLESPVRSGRARRTGGQGGHVPALEAPLLHPSRLSAQQVADFRAEHPDGLVVIHPEAPQEAVAVADEVGSTGKIIQVVENAPAGSTIAVGTEIHLVNRLAEENPDKTVVSLDPLIWPCSTMNPIDLPHLAWVLEELLENRVQNRISVNEDTADWACVVLQRMLNIT